MFNFVKTFGSSLLNGISKSSVLTKQIGYFSTWNSLSYRPITQSTSPPLATQNCLSRALLQVDSNNLYLSRNVTKFSLKTGKKKSVNAVLTRYFRLNNGLWIRRRAGAHKRHWRKNCLVKYDLAQHVVCTKSQCIMFDKMITDHHKKRTYYIDDPFEPYQVRNNFDYVLPVKKR